MSSITISAKKLKGLVDTIAPHTTDGMMPTLSCIQFRSYKGVVTAGATDRFTIGIAREVIEDVEPGFSARVSVTDLRTILSVFRPSRRVNPVITLTVDSENGRLVVEESGGLSGLLAASFAFKLNDFDVPSLEGLVKKWEAPDKPVERFALNPSLLAKFAHAQRHGEPLLIESGGPNKPCVVSVGDYFIGLIMPVRDLGSTAVVGADWLELLTEETNPAKKATTAGKAA